MWTTENRPRYNRDKLRYPSDPTDAEWQQMGIPFTDLSGLVRMSGADDRVIWRRSDSDRLLGESVEEQPASL